MAPDFHLEPGMLVQLNPATVRDIAYAGCVLVVTNTLAWGVIGYVQGIGVVQHLPGYQSLYRANWEEIEVVGIANWMTSPPEQEGDIA
jgi:hypothetical protein